MLVVLSPAKNLNLEPVRRALPSTQPALLSEAGMLMASCRRQSVKKIAALMDLSDKLARLNHERFAAWTEEHTEANSAPAALMFDGDTYKGLDAPSLSDEELAYAQDHVVLLSGLYGALRPLDLMQPYRLEMGSRLSTRRGKTLYAFWKERVTRHLLERLDGHEDRTVVHCASQEYFAVLQPRLLPSVLQVDFREEREDGRSQVISFFAKRARGALARFLVQGRVDRREGVRDFAEQGYAFASALSSTDHFVFVRPHSPERDRALTTA